MSIICCDNCSNLIDTDFDVEAYNKAHDQWLCPPCRADWHWENDKAEAFLSQTEER